MVYKYAYVYFRNREIIFLRFLVHLGCQHWVSFSCLIMTGIITQSYYVLSLSSFRPYSFVMVVSMPFSTIA